MKSEQELVNEYPEIYELHGEDGYMKTLCDGCYDA